MMNFSTIGKIIRIPIEVDIEKCSKESCKKCEEHCEKRKAEKKA